MLKKSHLIFGATCAWFGVLRAQEPSSAFQGRGICQFVLDHYTLTPQSEAAINAEVVKALHVQNGKGPPTESAALLERLYPGGLQQMAQDWHRWIREAGARVLGSEKDALMERVRSK